MTATDIKLAKMEQKVSDMSKQIDDIKDDLKGIKSDIEALKITLARYAAGITVAWAIIEMGINLFFKQQ